MSFYQTHLYSQNDPAYKNEKLGKSTPRNGTIGNKGCTLTAIANLHNALFNTNIDPSWLNKQFTAKGVYAYDSLGYANVIWSNVARVLPQLKFIARDRNYSNPTVWAWINISPRVPVIVQVWISVKFPSHFVLAIGGGKIVDSLDGKVKPFGTYQNPIGSARFGKS